MQGYPTFAQYALYLLRFEPDQRREMIQEYVDAIEQCEEIEFGKQLSAKANLFTVLRKYKAWPPRRLPVKR